LIIGDESGIGKKKEVFRYKIDRNERERRKESNVQITEMDNCIFCFKKT